MTKKNSCIIIFACIFSFLFTFCTKPGTTPTPTPVNNNSNTPYMSATVNGSLWTADNITTYEKYANTGLKAIAGTRNIDNSQLTVLLPQSVVANKKYDFDGKTIMVSFQNDTSSFSPYPSNPGAGNITVTNYSGGIMSGSFSGSIPSSGANSGLIVISGGKFTGDIQ